MSEEESGGLEGRREVIVRRHEWCVRVRVLEKKNVAYVRGEEKCATGDKSGM